MTGRLPNRRWLPSIRSRVSVSPAARSMVLTGPMVLASLALGGCGGDDVTQLPCRDGFERAADGHCYPTSTGFTTVDLDAAVANLPSCDPRVSPFLIDLDSGCALGMCPGHTFEQSVDAFGTGYSCFSASNDAYCLWPNAGVEGRWDDEDDDGLPDEKATNQRVHLTRDAVVATEDGLGTDASVGCFFESLGHPEEMIVVDTVDGLAIERLDYDRFGLLVDDTRDHNDYVGPDGIVDDIYLYGAL